MTERKRRGRPPQRPEFVPMYMWLIVELKCDQQEMRGQKRSVRQASKDLERVVFAPVHIAWKKERIRKLHEEAGREFLERPERGEEAAARLEKARAFIRQEGWDKVDANYSNWRFFASALGISLPSPIPPDAAGKLKRPAYQKIWGDWN